MDRFFLRALVRELAPRLLGRRARGLKRWDSSGFTLLLGNKRGLDLVVSLSPRAPGFYLGRPPVADQEAPSGTRFKKLLSGAELVRIEAAPLDRVVTLEWRHRKPSGARRSLELVLEWPGSRTGAFLVDSVSREVLDVLSPGTPRTVIGETFQPLKPPPGSREIPKTPNEFAERLTAVRQEGLSGARALRTASGLSPLLVEEMRVLESVAGLDPAAAFEQIVSRLSQAPRPVLLSPSPRDFRRQGAELVLSPIALSSRETWTAREFSSFNEAAAAFVVESHRLGSWRHNYQAASSELSKRLKKLGKLLERLNREREELRDPTELRRWGELLLAGLRQAKRANGEVMVPDPYREGSPLVRVPIDPRFDLARNARRFFERARKTIRSRELLEARLSKLRREIEYLETLEVALGDSLQSETLAPLVEELQEAGVVGPSPADRSPGRRAASRKKDAGPRLAPRRFPLSGGAIVLAGRSARSNEDLTFRIAKPEDLWFHASGSAGAHVVLRLPGGGEPGGRQIEVSAAVAAYFSKARGSTAVEVVYTPRQNVKKIPGAPPGTVRISRFETVRVRPALPPPPASTAAAGGPEASLDLESEEPAG